MKATPPPQQAPKLTKNPDHAPHSRPGSDGAPTFHVSLEPCGILLDLCVPSKAHVHFSICALSSLLRAYMHRLSHSLHAHLTMNSLPRKKRLVESTPRCACLGCRVALLWPKSQCSTGMPRSRRCSAAADCSARSSAWMERLPQQRQQRQQSKFPDLKLVVGETAAAGESPEEQPDIRLHRRSGERQYTSSAFACLCKHLRAQSRQH